MAGTPEFEIPDDLALLEFFGVDPSQRVDGLYVYELGDSGGTMLRFSFDLFARSVQTELSLEHGTCAVVVHECATRISIAPPALLCEFERSSSRTLLTITLTPILRVDWAILRVR